MERRCRVGLTGRGGCRSRTPAVDGRAGADLLDQVVGASRGMPAPQPPVTLRNELTAMIWIPGLGCDNVA